MIVIGAHAYPDYREEEEVPDVYCAECGEYLGVEDTHFGPPAWCDWRCRLRSARAGNDAARPGPRRWRAR